jgi:hypothetical protein
MKTRFVSALLSATVFCPILVSGTWVTNTPPWDGAQQGIYFGGGTYSYPTWGQVVTVPSVDTRLTSFTFELISQDLSRPDQPFGAYVQSWDETTSRPTGPVLFSQYLSTGPSLTWTAFTINTDLTLSAGSKVLLYFSTLGLAHPANDFGFAWAMTWETYSGGNTYLSLYGMGATQLGSVDNLTTQTWWGHPAGADSAFTAQFDTAAPEPSSIFSVAGGTVLLLLGWRRRRN